MIDSIGIPLDVIGVLGSDDHRIYNLRGTDVVLYYPSGSRHMQLAQITLSKFDEEMLSELRTKLNKYMQDYANAVLTTDGLNFVNLDKSDELYKQQMDIVQSIRDNRFANCSPNVFDELSKLDVKSVIEENELMDK